MLEDTNSLDAAQMVLFLQTVIMKFIISILILEIFHSGDIPRATSYVVYISHLIRFSSVSSRVADFNK